MAAPAPSRRPLVLTALLIAVAVVLAGVAVGFWVRDDRGSAARLQLSDTEQQVLSSARQEYVTLQTFRRSRFDADYANAAAGLTGQALQQLQANKATLKSRLTTQAIDTSATITAASVSASAKNRYEVLILAAIVTKNSAGKTVSAAKPSPATLVMVPKGDHWVISEVNLVDVSGNG